MGQSEGYVIEIATIREGEVISHKNKQICSNPCDFEFRYGRPAKDKNLYRSG